MGEDHSGVPWWAATVSVSPALTQRIDLYHKYARYTISAPKPPKRRPTGSLQST